MSFEDKDHGGKVDALMVGKKHREDSLADCVRDALNAYFAQLDGHAASGIYQMVMEEVERPLFQTVMEHTGGNQTQAAILLGISRSTLRKKLARFHID
ncbi:helix-turn-helix domain-containing protein [Thiolapillus sp.]